MRYLIIAGILLFGCANAQQSDQSVRAAIDAQNIKYEQGYLLRDVDMVLGVHTQDATVYPPNRIQAKGQSGIRQMIEGDLAFANPYILDLETISLEVHGDTAIEVGRYKAKLGLFDGTVINDEGNTIVIWKKQTDGRWLYDKDIFNSTVPLE